MISLPKIILVKSKNCRITKILQNNVIIKVCQTKKLIMVDKNVINPLRPFFLAVFNFPSNFLTAYVGVFIFTGSLQYESAQ